MRFATGRSPGREASEASEFFRRTLGAGLAAHPQVRDNHARWFGAWEAASIVAYWRECVAGAARAGKAPVWLFVDGLNGAVAAPTLRARKASRSAAPARPKYTRDDYESGMVVVTPEGDKGVVLAVDYVWLELEDGRSFRVTECVPVKGVAA